MGPNTNPDDDKKPKKAGGGENAGSGGGATPEGAGGTFDLSKLGFGRNAGRDGATSGGPGQSRPKLACGGEPETREILRPDEERLLPGGPPVSEDALFLWRKFGRETCVAAEMDRLVEYNKLANTYEAWRQARRQIIRQERIDEAASNY